LRCAVTSVPVAVTMMSVGPGVDESHNSEDKKPSALSRCRTLPSGIEWPPRARARMGSIWKKPDLTAKVLNDRARARARGSCTVLGNAPRLRRASLPHVWPSPLDAPFLARLPGQHRPGRCRHGSRGLRPSAHSLWRGRLASDVLHERDGTLANKRDGRRIGTDAVAPGTAGGVGDPEQGVSWVAA